jgi:hypothetical protein
VPMPQEEVTRAWEATRVEAVHPIEPSAQEAIVAWESIVVAIRGAEDRAALAEREAREMSHPVLISDRMLRSRRRFWIL